MEEIQGDDSVTNSFFVVPCMSRRSPCSLSKVIVNGTVGQEPHIYCMKNVEGIWPRLSKVWTKFTVSLVAPNGSNLTLQPGNSSVAIEQNSRRTFWAGLWEEPKDKKMVRVEFSPFEGGCVGVASLKGNTARRYQLVFKQGERVTMQTLGPLSM